MLPSDWLVNNEVRVESNEGIPEGWCRTQAHFYTSEVKILVVEPEEDFPATVRFMDYNYLGAMEINYSPEGVPSVADMSVHQLVEALRKLRIPHLLFTDSSDPQARRIIKLYLGTWASIGKSQLRPPQGGNERN